MSAIHVIEPPHNLSRLRARKRTWAREDALAGRTPRKAARRHYVRDQATAELLFVLGAVIMIIGYLFTRA